jgi:hypothetical protein
LWYKEPFFIFFDLFLEAGAEINTKIVGFLVDLKTSKRPRQHQVF